MALEGAGPTGMLVWGAGGRRQGYSPGARTEGRQRVGSLEGSRGRIGAGVRIGGWCGFVVTNQSIPFSNKSKENQCKLNSEVQYRLRLSKHSDNIGQMSPCTQNTWESGGCRRWSWPRGGAHMCMCEGREKAKGFGMKSTCGLPCYTLEFVLVSLCHDPLAVGGEGEGWVWAVRDDTQLLQPLAHLMGRMSNLDGFSDSGWMV